MRVVETESHFSLVNINRITETTVKPNILKSLVSKVCWKLKKVERKHLSKLQSLR